MEKQGHLIVISGPSGVGKGTLVDELIRQNPDLKISISATTRKKRPRELDGKNYFFLTEDQFSQMIDEGQFIEYANVHGHYYGTPKKFVEEQIQMGFDVILEIDVQGAEQVRNNFKEGVQIFILPPHKEDLVSRIRNRGAETEEEIAIRMRTAEEEIKKMVDYDYAVINDQIPACAEKILHILDAENLRVNHQIMEKYWREFHD